MLPLLVASEDHVFKGIALGAPYVKVIGMSRAPLTAAMVGDMIDADLASGKLSREYAQYGETRDQIFITSGELRAKFGDKFDEIPGGAIGVYTYFERLAQGLKQLMAGSRKFAPVKEFLDVQVYCPFVSFFYVPEIYRPKSDLAALTKEAAEVTGIPYIMDLDA